ncbi:hypothetical protein [Saliphagus sp. LR7]|uniref:hypothetical protein n=1 Tax=Saliphagus sp. LR7 TaxID=2282654 RepID=UPI000DF7625E|nr:hypothetical protein [Saliphagus sp. LR7]
MTTGPFCGSMGCRTEAEAIIDHPDHGERVVCAGCADGHEVVAILDDGERTVLDRAKVMSQQALARADSAERELEEIAQVNENLQQSVQELEAGLDE